MNLSHRLRLVMPGVAALLALLAVAGGILAGGENQSDDPSAIAMPQDTNVPTIALGTGFSFQGQLADDDGVPIEGTCDLRFGLYDAPNNGTKIGEVLRDSVTLVNGLFAVTLDFDRQAFRGEARWLELATRCPAGGGAYNPVDERQEVTAVPYALSLQPGARVEGSIAAGSAFEAGLRVTNNSPNYPIGLFGIATAKSGPAIGVAGNNSSPNGFAVYGYSGPEGTAVRGEALKGAGLWGSSVDWVGAYGYSAKAIGVMGESPNGGGVFGKSQKWRGVSGESVDEHGVFGTSTNGSGVAGISANWVGVSGESNSPSAAAISARNTSSGPGLYATSTNGPAAVFVGTTRTSVLQITGGSDLAERFETSGNQTAVPGTVMVIDPDNPGHLTISTIAYDRKVAGVVSGAGDVDTGLILHQEGVLEGDAVVAIAGRVYVMAEALANPIEPGDLLTTSALAGHVMKAEDLERAQGAIIGKAMTGLASGTGLVLVLINLQ